MGGPGSGRRNAPRDTRGRFAALAMDFDDGGAAKKIAKVSEATQKLKKHTEQASTVTDANTASTDKNTTSKGKNRQEQNALIDSQTRFVIMLQASTSALNQGTGAIYKMIAGLEAMGRIDNERALELQKFVRQVEFFTGGLELGLATLTIYTTVTEMNTAARLKNAAATNTQAAAQTKLNAAILANPYVRVAIVLLGIGYSLKVVYDETGKVTGGIESLNNLLEKMVRTLKELGSIVDNNPIRRLVESDSMHRLNDALSLETLGVG